MGANHQRTVSGVAPVNWATPFVGIPDLAKGRTVAGADCWGLAMLVYREVCGIELPDYASEYLDDRDHAELGAIFAREKVKASWLPVDRPDAYDLVLFRIGRHDSHVGIWAAPNRMLHTVMGDYSKIGRFDQSPWLGRLVGIYRWTGQ